MYAVQTRRAQAINLRDVYENLVSDNVQCVPGIILSIAPAILRSAHSVYIIYTTRQCYACCCARLAVTHSHG